VLPSNVLVRYSVVLEGRLQLACDAVVISFMCRVLLVVVSEVSFSLRFRF
jgi:hypothetical protein